MTFFSFSSSNSASFCRIAKRRAASTDGDDVADVVEDSDDDDDEEEEHVASAPSAAAVLYSTVTGVEVRIERLDENETFNGSAWLVVMDNGEDEEMCVANLSKEL